MSNDEIRISSQALSPEVIQKMFDRAREYKGAETQNFVPENHLTPEREAELKAHLAQCDIPYFGCDDCYELYSNIGYQAYEAELMKLPEEDRAFPI